MVYSTSNYIEWKFFRSFLSPVLNFPQTVKTAVTVYRAKLCILLLYAKEPILNLVSTDCISKDWLFFAFLECLRSLKALINISQSTKKSICPLSDCNLTLEKSSPALESKKRRRMASALSSHLPCTMEKLSAAYCGSQPFLNQKKISVIVCQSNVSATVIFQAEAVQGSYHVPNQWTCEEQIKHSTRTNKSILPQLWTTLIARKMCTGTDLFHSILCGQQTESSTSLILHPSITPHR